MITDPVTGCLLASNKILYNTVGNSIGLTVGPNPSNGSFQLEFSVNTPDNTAVQIFDMIGQKIYDQELSNFSGVYSQQIDVMTVASGIYVVRVVHGQSTYEYKIKIVH